VVAERYCDNFLHQWVNDILWKYVVTMNEFCGKKRHMIYLYPISTCLLPRHASWKIGAGGFAEEDISTVNLTMRQTDAPVQQTTSEEFLK
jgi:hypothetical protein